MANFKNGQTVWYLRPGMAVPLEMMYLGIVFNSPGLHALLTENKYAVMNTRLECIYATKTHAEALGRLWVNDRLDQITVDIRKLEEERESLKRERSNA